MLLVLLMAARTQAEWRPPLAVPGSPTSVLDVWSPGIFSVGYTRDSATGEGIYLFKDGVVTHKLEGVEAAGAFYRLPEDCLAIVLYDSAGSRDSINAMGVPCLGASSEINDPSGALITRVKHARGGGAVALSGESASDTPAVLLSQSNIYGTSFSPLNFEANHVFSDIPGVVRVDDKTVEVFIPTDGRDSSIYRVTEGADDKLTPEDAGMGTIQAVEAFAAGSPAKSYVVLGTERGFIQAPGSRPLFGSWLVQKQELGGGLGVASVAMNVEAGGPAGSGFGMAVISGKDGAGHSIVMSALPMSSDTQAGTVWRVREIPANMQNAPLKTVACADASYCVFAADADSGTGPNLFVYVNSAAPTLRLSASAGVSLSMDPDGGVADGSVSLDVDGGVVDGSMSLDETTPVTLSFESSDLDGDPVLLSAPDSGLAAGLASLSSREIPDGGLAVDMKTRALCESKSYLGTLHVQTTDGLLDHERHGYLAVYGTHTVHPPRPDVRLADGTPVPPGTHLSLRTGAAPLTFQATSLMTAAGCTLTPMWSALTSGAAGLTLDTSTGDARLTPPADFCMPDGQDFDYQLLVQDDGGLASAPSDFTVHLESSQIELSKGHLVLEEADAGTPSGRGVRLSTDLNCIPERGLSADLQVREDREGPVLLSTNTAVSREGSDWTLPSALGCHHYVLTGLLRQKDELSSSSMTSLDLPARPAGLNAPPDQVLKVQCGEPVSTSLAVSLPTGACQTEDITWKQTSGPDLVQSTLKGLSPTLATRDTGFDLLAKQPVVLDVTADAGSGDSVTTTYTLHITADPFVTVSHRTELPAASETDLIGVFTELKSSAACDVAGVQYDEQLEGLTYVEGSARFNGKDVSADWDVTTSLLSIKNLTLAGGATGTLTYLARPHLVGERHIQGEAHVGTVTISQSDAVAPSGADSGCGCTSSAGSAPVLLALGALLAAARRRRA